MSHMVDLEKLSSSSRELIAREINDYMALLYLAKDPHIEVRMSVAINPKAPVEALEILLKDSSVEVRRLVAYNPGVSTAILEKLLEDPIQSIQTIAAVRLKKI